MTRIIEPFVRVRANEQPDNSGAGLGLPISQTFARGMGGALTVASTVGVGSAFTLTLPAPPEE